MKKLIYIILLSILPLTINASDVYYCSDDAITGFDRSENFKQKNFNPQKAFGIGRRYPIVNKFKDSSTSMTAVAEVSVLLRGTCCVPLSVIS